MLPEMLVSYINQGRRGHQQGRPQGFVLTIFKCFKRMSEKHEKTAVHLLYKNGHGLDQEERIHGIGSESWGQSSRGRRGTPSGPTLQGRGDGDVG